MCMATPRLDVDPHVFRSTIWIFPESEEVAPRKAAGDFMPFLQVTPVENQHAIKKGVVTYMI